MKRKFKSVICLVMAMVVMVTAFSICANATVSGGENVKIVFYKPANWGNDIYIHLWNANSQNTQWPGVAMTSNSNGTYTFTSNEITSCNFVINDNNGNQTVDLYAQGYVGVKDNCVFKKSNDSIYLYFEKPAGWSSNVRAYYYSNDNNNVALTAWPGVAMTQNYGEETYYLRISDMADVRVIFTDGTNQYSASNQPGIAVTAGKDLIYQNGKYTTATHEWISVDQPKNYAVVGQDFNVTMTMDSGVDLPLCFYDQNNNAVIPTSETEVEHNGKVQVSYLFNFANAGTKTIQICYIYASSIGYTNKTFDVTVFNSNDIGSYLNCDNHDVNVGSNYTLTTHYNSGQGYKFYDKDGNVINYNSVSYDYNNQTVSYTFTALQIGKSQKIFMYSFDNNSLSTEVYTGRFVSINVWQNAI